MASAIWLAALLSETATIAPTSARRLSVHDNVPAAIWRSSSTRIGSFITLAEGNASSAFKPIFSPLVRLIAAAPTWTFGPPTRNASAAMRCWSGLATGVGGGVGAAAGLAVGVALGLMVVLAATCWPAAAEAGAAAVAGRRNTWPTLSWSAFVTLFNLIKASTAAPVASEMSHNVSPVLTV